MKHAAMMCFDQLWRDVLYSARALVRTGAFTAAVVLTLALAIGANTAIFNVADEALFRPLPLPQPEELTAVYNYSRKTSRYLSSSYPDYIDYRDRTHSFERLSAYVRFPLGVGVGGRTVRLVVEAVTPEYFQMLRLPPRAGAMFTTDDVPEAMLSESLWQREFGGNPDILGSTIRIEKQPFTVIGIVPARYRGSNLNWSEPPEVWIPLRALPVAVPRLGQMRIFNERAARWLVIFGRRKADVSVDQAQAELQTMAAAIASSERGNEDVSAVAFEASRSKFWPAYRGQVTLALSVFAIAAAMLLLLACANISNLMLERGIARQREIAVRLALGVSRIGLLRQMCVESLLLVTPGFLGALAVSRAIAGLVARYPSAIGNVALSLEPDFNGRVLLFGFVASIAAAVFLGLAPALQAARSGPHGVLRESGIGVAGAGGRRLREVMVIVQIALTAALLAGGGLFARALLRGYSMDVGFRSDHLLVSSFDVSALPPDARTAFESRLLQETGMISGIESAAVTPHVPLLSGRIAAQVSAGAETRPVNFRYAGPGFFHTMGIPLVAGREFGAAEGSARIAVLSEDLARRLSLNVTQTIGRRVLVRRGNDAATEVEVVGIARAVRSASVWEEPEPQIYVPAGSFPAQSWIIRTRGNPASLLPAVRGLWDRMAPDIPLSDLRTGDEIIAQAMAPQHLAVRLFAASGLLALTLACVGVYGLTAFSVARRTREIGIRIAIGAAPRELVRRLVARSILLSGVGVACGLAAAGKLGKLAAPLLREVAPDDAVTFVAVAALLLLLAGVATLVPAARAARVNPAVALKSE